MRTTLDIDDAVLAAAQRWAHERRIPLRAEVSELTRRGLATPEVESRSGFPIFPPPSPPTVTDEIVAQYRDDVPAALIET